MRSLFRPARPVTVCSLPFDPPAFSPAKLTVAYEADFAAAAALPPEGRRYTLTHNDLTGALLLTIGSQFSAPQLSGWYIRLLRDEVLAEWAVPQGGAPQLHVYCHVSGQERWLAPPQLRNYIFKREMPLVLDTLAWAERALLAEHPEYAAARVFVHLNSTIQDLNCTVEWGRLGFRDSWRRTPSSILQRLLRYWQFPGISEPAGARLRDGATGATTAIAGSMSGKRRGLLARLDDSVDEGEFTGPINLDDPYSEFLDGSISDSSSSQLGEVEGVGRAGSGLAGSGIDSGVQRATTQVFASGPAPGSALAAVEQEGSSAFDERGARERELRAMLEALEQLIGDAAGSSSHPDGTKHLWLPGPQTRAADLTGAPPCDHPVSAAEQLYARSRGIDMASDDSAGSVTSSGSTGGSHGSSIDSSGSSIDLEARWQAGACSNHGGSPAQPDETERHHVDVLKWRNAGHQWPRTSDGSAVPCTASYDERWSEASPPWSNRSTGPL